MFGVSVLGVLSKTERRLVSEFNTMKKDGVVFAPWVSPRPPEAITKTISKSRQSKLRFIVTSHDSKEVIAHLRFPLRTDRSKNGRRLRTRNCRYIDPIEWAPVHWSIAGPDIFVIAKDFWYTPVRSQDRKARGLCASILRICSDCWRRNEASSCRSPQRAPRPCG